MAITDSYNYGFNEFINAMAIKNIDVLGIISRRNLKKMNYTINKGNSKKFTVYIKDEHLNIIDLTYATITMNWLEKRNSVNTIINKQGFVLDAQNGIAQFIYEPSDTANLNVKQYFWNIKLTLQTGEIYTIAEGTIVVKN